MATLNFMFPMFFLIAAAATLGFACKGVWNFIFSRKKPAVSENPPNKSVQKDVSVTGASD